MAQMQPAQQEKQSTGLFLFGQNFIQILVEDSYYRFAVSPSSSKAAMICVSFVFDGA